MNAFYDTHAHLDYTQLSDEIDGVIQRAAAAGITKIVTVGTDFESSQRCIQLANRFDQVFAAVGWHPCDAMDAPDDIRPELRALASQPKVVAIGETGLDHFRLPSSQPEGKPEEDEAVIRKQEQLFLQHLEVAQATGLNCIVHQRKCLQPTLDVAIPFMDSIQCVFHCFVDDPAAMRSIIGRGSKVSFTGIVTFKNAADIRETVRETPSNGMMLETDSPFLAPVPYRGKRCEPAYVKEISEAVAETREVDISALSKETCAVAEDFFGGFRR
jgi:TatD DNase family protein